MRRGGTLPASSMLQEATALTPIFRVWSRWLIPVLLVGLVAVLWVANRAFVDAAPARNDFAARWEGGRAWVSERISPYDPAVSLEAQERVYGRPANEQRGEDPFHFLYPFLSLMVFAPLGLLDFEPAYALWMSLVEICLFASTWLWCRTLRWKGSGWTSIAILAFSVLWFPAFETLILSQVVALEALLLAAGMAAVQARREAVAGLLLAASLLKPQLGIGLILLVALWAAFSGRRELLGWLATGVVLMVGATLLMQPDWPMQMIRQVLDYAGLPVFLSPVARLSQSLGFGQVGVFVLAGLLLAYLFWEWKETFGGEEHRFLWTAALTQAVVLLLMPFGIAANLILLIFPIVLILQAWYGRQGRAVDAPATLLLGLFAAGSWLLSLGSLENGEPSLWVLVGFPLLTIGGLFWVRWWSTRAETWSELGSRAV